MRDQISTVPNSRERRPCSTGAESPSSNKPREVILEKSRDVGFAWHGRIGVEPVGFLFRSEMKPFFPGKEGILIEELCYDFFSAMVVVVVVMEMTDS